MERKDEETRHGEKVESREETWLAEGEEETEQDMNYRKEREAETCLGGGKAKRQGSIRKHESMKERMEI